MSQYAAISLAELDGDQHHSTSGICQVQKNAQNICQIPGHEAQIFDTVMENTIYLLIRDSRNLWLPAEWLMQFTTSSGAEDFQSMLRLVSARISSQHPHSVNCTALSAARLQLN